MENLSLQQISSIRSHRVKPSCDQPCRVKRDERLQQVRYPENMIRLVPTISSVRDRQDAVIALPGGTGSARQGARS